MMKKNSIFWSLLTMIMVGMMSVACSKDDRDEPGPAPEPALAPVAPSLVVSGVDAPFAADVSSMQYAQELTITCNTTWQITEKPSWIDIDRLEGSGDAKVKVWPNKTNTDSDTELTGKITIKADTIIVNKTVSQRAGIDAELYVAPKDVVTLSDGFAFDFTYGSKVKYYYVAKYLPSALDRKTDAEIIAEMSADIDNRDTPSDGYVTSWRNQSSLTEYVICTVGYDNNGRCGSLTKTSITTKSSRNQAAAYISDVTYDNVSWHWTTTVNGYVTKYYMWYISNTNLANTTDAAIAWFFKKAMKENPSNFAPIAQGDSWSAARNGATTFHVATWALDVNGDFSGIIDRFVGSISSSSRKKLQNYVRDNDESRRYKTEK